MGKRIRILLADDHDIVREGLRSLLEKETDIEVVGEAENGHAAVELTAALAPDVVLMDITMPDLNGVEATRRIAAVAGAAGQGRRAVSVIALSMHSHRRFVA